MLMQIQLFLVHIAYIQIALFYQATKLLISQTEMLLLVLIITELMLALVIKAQLIQLYIREVIQL